MFLVKEKSTPSRSGVICYTEGGTINLGKSCILRFAIETLDSTALNNVPKGKYGAVILFIFVLFEIYNTNAIYNIYYIGCPKLRVTTYSCS